MPLPTFPRAAVLLIGIGIAAGLHAQQPPQRSPGVIELMNQIEALNADLNRLRGQIEVLNNSLENAQRRQRDMYLDLDTRLRRIEPAAGDSAQKPVADLESRIKKLEQQLSELEARSKRPEPTAAAAPESAPAPASTTAAAVPQSTAPAAAGDSPGGRRAYDNALALYKAGDFQGAIAGFDGFVKRNPRDALAPNAQYWIGDAWFNLRDFRAASSAQQALIANYPDSPKVPDAMLNLASSQMALGDNAAAKKTLEDLVKRFPQSDAAEKARQRLPKLR